MPKIFTPSNQLKLTNVSIVRMKKNGKRYEIACYKNKVLAWRNKEETDIDEVLHTNTVFTNVSKGLVANRDDLVKDFKDKSSLSEICKEILNKGEIQVTDKERHDQLDKVVTEIATIISDQYLNSDTEQPYGIEDIEKAMKELHFVAKPGGSTEQQAIDLVTSLKEKMPIKRARLRVSVEFTMKDWKELKQKILKLCTNIEDDEFDIKKVKMIAIIDPGHYRAIDELLKASTKGTGLLKTLNVLNVEEDNDS